MPAPGLQLSDAEEISVQVANWGTVEVNNVPVTAITTRPDGSIQEIAEVVPEAIAPGGTFNYTFVEKVDFSQSGDYRVSFAVNLEEDPFTHYGQTLTMTTGKVKSYNGGLPFFEDFEQAESVAGEVVYDVTGVKGASAYASSSSSVWMRQLPAFGSTVAHFYPQQQQFWLPVDQDLIFTMDLSDYKVATDQLALQVKLQFQPTFNRDGVDPVDENAGIFIRGNTDMPWLLVYNWSEEGDKDEILELAFNEISNTLLEAGQEYGETFQLRFGYMDYFVLSIDDVSLSLFEPTAILSSAHHLSEELSVISESGSKHIGFIAAPTGKNA